MELWLVCGSSSRGCTALRCVGEVRSGAGPVLGWRASPDCVAEVLEPLFFP